MPSIYLPIDSESPETTEIIALRRAVQEAVGLKLDSARPGQMLCGRFVHYAQNSWAKWEKGGAKMHPAVWELAQLKLKPIIDGEPINDPELQKLLDYLKEEHRGKNTKKSQGPVE